jgi:hypothetical protein
MHEQSIRRIVQALGPEARDIFDATIVLKVDEIYSIVPGRGEAEPTF